MVRRFSVSEIRTEIQRQTSKTLPDVPQGYFDVLSGGDGYQVALFKHTNVAGCRSTSSHQHGKLPLPLPCLKDTAMITKEPNIRVGFNYIHGHPQSYTVHDGKVSLNDSVLPLTKMDDAENSHTMSMMFSLISTFGDRYEIATRDDRS